MDVASGVEDPGTGVSICEPSFTFNRFLPLARFQVPFNARFSGTLNVKNLSSELSGIFNWVTAADCNEYIRHVGYKM